MFRATHTFEPRRHLEFLQMGKANYKKAVAVFLAVHDWEMAVHALHYHNVAVTKGAGGAQFGRQWGLIKVPRYRLLADPSLASALDAALGEDLTPVERANVLEMQRILKYELCVPGELQSDLATAVGACQGAWAEAKKRNDGSMAQGEFERVIELVRRKAAGMADQFGGDPYDHLLEIDGYAPGMTGAEIDALFADYAEQITPLVLEIIGGSSSSGGLVGLSGKTFDPELQLRVFRELIKQMGFTGMVMPTHAPCTAGYRPDVYMGIFNDPKRLMLGIASALHEGGHGLYEEGIMPDLEPGLMIGRNAGLHLHEGMSMIWERFIGRTRAFWSYLGPCLRQTFEDQRHSLASDELFGLSRRVQPGLIRVEADNLCYGAHIVLRYQIERQLLTGEMGVADVPEAWSQGMKRLLGLEISTDEFARGYGQDSHWFGGRISYFPTYLLGILMAAQLWEALVRDIGDDVHGQIAFGDFTQIRVWLQEKVWRHGRLKTAQQIIRDATGSDLSVGPFERWIRATYLS